MGTTSHPAARLLGALLIAAATSPSVRAEPPPHEATAVEHLHDHGRSADHPSPLDREARAGHQARAEHHAHAGQEPHTQHEFHGGEADHRLPVEVGEAAFSALAEIVRLLDADPTTDWTRVNVDGLREHLIDMHHVLISATVESHSVAGGFEARITGSGRTLQAIRRMIPAHAAMMNGHQGLQTNVVPLEAGDGVRLTVTTEAGSVDRLRGLGVFGFLTSGGHHRPHHLAIGRGNAAAHAPHLHERRK
ncbi:MAG: hypothetical protein AAGN46_13975 [Acidobacteriota bacterium]